MRQGPSWDEEVIVLGSTDYGESDRIVALLGAESGRIAAFARGARKSKRRFAGALEPFTRLDAQLSDRPGSDLALLRGCSIREAHFAIREDLDRIAHASHAAELCRELTRERQPVPGLYALLGGYLASLCSEAPRWERLLAFELVALGEVGLAPRLDACALCSRPWAPALREGGPLASGGLGGTLIFDPGHGGLVCSGCRPQAYPGALHLAARVVASALCLQREGPETSLRFEDDALRRGVQELVHRFTRQAFGRSPRSLAFLSQLD